MAGSQVRQNFDANCESGINRQINQELFANYVYLSMSLYFDRDCVALPGFREFFKKSSNEEMEHAQKLMKYQNARGGRIVLEDIRKPPTDDWESGIRAMQAALELEKTVNQSLLDLHAVASDNGDAQMCEFLQAEFLNEQVEAIKQLSEYVTNLQQVGTGLGEYMFDKETLGGGED